MLALSGIAAVQYSDLLGIQSFLLCTEQPSHKQKACCRGMEYKGYHSSDKGYHSSNKGYHATLLLQCVNCMTPLLVLQHPDVVS